jgi:hypothetical protein
MAMFKRKENAPTGTGGQAFMRPVSRTADPMGEPVTAKEPREDMSGAALVMPREQPRIGEKEVSEAVATLSKYKDGKSNLENRIVEDEEWYKLRHWEVIRNKRKKPDDPAEVRPEPASAWLFNAIMNKHADACDNYPEPNVLPRERDDENDAKTLSEILPVIIERNGFEQTYSDNWWEKLKHGTAAYGVFWNSELENGLGDIDIRPIDLLNIFWEPGIVDIQKSRNLFIVDLWDTDLLEQTYPQFKGKLGGNVIDVKQYVYDDDVDITDKSLVVDCYYKVRSPGGRTLLHMMKFCGDSLLFASENEEQYAETGFYDHGQYPVVFDTLFPEKGTPVGFGYVSICKDPQLYIDKLGQNILENSMMATKVRYFAANSTGVNEQEFLDWSKPVVHVEGSSLDDTKLRQIVVSPMDDIYVNVLQMKVDELKETAANRDVNSGGVGSGVTAAAAIAALQEAGNKNSRDMISAAYRSYTEMTYLCIELIRQFYDEMRTFRITGQMPGGYQFVDYSNASLKDQPIAPGYPGQDMEPGYVPSFRRPVFDIKIRAEKRNPFSQMSMNETAKELYKLGAFNPERATEALIMLDMMEFEGIDSVKEKVQQGQTLLSICQQMSQQMDQMAAIIQATTGKDMGVGGGTGTAGAAPSSGAPVTSSQSKGGGRTLASAAGDSQKQNMTAYVDRLAKRATPNMKIVSNKDTPGR